MSRRSYVQRLSDLSGQVLACHAYGHAWELQRVSRQSPVGLEVWEVLLRCYRCTTQRLDQVEPGTYDLYRRQYNYPDGYRLVEPATTGDKREEVIRRAQRRAT